MIIGSAGPPAGAIFAGIFGKRIVSGETKTTAVAFSLYLKILYVSFACRMI